VADIPLGFACPTNTAVGNTGTAIASVSLGPCSTVDRRDRVSPRRDRIRSTAVRYRSCSCMVSSPRRAPSAPSQPDWVGRDTCTHCIDFGGLFGRYNARPVEELAHIVAERVDQLVRDHPRERIVLVGHSLGGLIGRYYVQNLDGADRVRHLLTLGTPHRGTAWACSGYLVGHVLPSLRQVVPGSRLLRDLADDRFPDGVRLTSMYSRRDPFCPPSACRLETGRAHLTILK